MNLESKKEYVINHFNTFVRETGLYFKSEYDTCTNILTVTFSVVPKPRSASELMTFKINLIASIFYLSSVVDDIKLKVKDRFLNNRPSVASIDIASMYPVSMVKHKRNTSIPGIKNVVFNNPATIVFWSDGTKTVVKVSDGEIFDPEKGLAMAISKKALGNAGNYYEDFKMWLK